MGLKQKNKIKDSNSTPIEGCCDQNMVFVTFWAGYI